MPKISVIVRKAYGAGLYAMAGPAFDPDCCIALPSASIAVMGPQAAINAVYYNQLQAISDEAERAARTEELREEYAQGHRHPAPRLGARDRRDRPARGAARRADPPVRAGRWQGSSVAGEAEPGHAGVTACGRRFSASHASISSTSSSPNWTAASSAWARLRGTSSGRCERGTSPGGRGTRPRSRGGANSLAGNAGAAPRPACGRAPRPGSSPASSAQRALSGGIAERYQRPVAGPPARRAGRARRDAEHDRVRGLPLVAVGAQVAAETDALGVAGALEDQLDGDVAGGRRVERSGELDRDRDAGAVVARGRARIRGRQLEQQREGEHDHDRRGELDRADRLANDGPRSGGSPIASSRGDRQRQPAEPPEREPECGSAYRGGGSPEAGACRRSPARPAS